MDVLSEQSSVSGICGISVNCGFADGLPIGMQLMAPMFKEDAVLGAAYAFEQSTDFHTKFADLEESTNV